RRQGQGDRRANEDHAPGRQVERLQHGAHRGARGRQPHGMRPRDDDLGGGAHNVLEYERPIDDAEFPNGRNDAEWMKHTLWFSEGNRLDYKPVQLTPLTVDSIPPKVRTF